MLQQVPLGARALRKIRRLSEEKMPYDKTIFLTELLDKNGIVIALHAQSALEMTLNGNGYIGA